MGSHPAKGQGNGFGTLREGGSGSPSEHREKASRSGQRGRAGRLNACECVMREAERLARERLAVRAVAVS
jgi:hypothetical protein